MTYGRTGKFTAQPGRRDELAALLSQTAHELGNEVRDCLLYAVSISGVDDVWVWEVWTDKSAHGSSLELDSVRELIAQARPMVTDISEPTEVEMLGGAGLAMALETMW